MSRKKRFLSHLLTCVLAVMFSAGSLFAQLIDMTYQGYLRNAGAPANGTFNMRFLLYGMPSGGTVIGAFHPQARSSSLL